METLYFLKFWKPSPSSIPISTPLVETDNDFEVQGNQVEEEDSFFDLEIITEQTLVASSPSDQISKRKVLPIEPISKPQSPISLLKSARVSIFKKPKSVLLKKPEKKNTLFLKTEHPVLLEAQTKKIPEASSSPAANLTRLNSSKNNETDESKTERVSKDAINKYLKLIKPLYLKVSKRYNDKVKDSGEFTVGSPAKTPAASMCSPRKEKQGNFPAGIRVVCKHLGKSKSATTAPVTASPVNRRDDSLLVQADGIQSAILHCKRSFNSRDSSCLSRSTSWTSSSMNSYYSDSSMLSRFAIETHERSARSSIEEELACF